MDKTPGLTGSVIVCVTPQLSCSRLIKAGELIAMENNAPLKVLSVFPEGSGADAETAGILEKLHEAASLAGAEMSVYFNDSPDILTAVVAAKENAALLVVGFPGEKSSGYINRVHSLLPKLPVIMVDGELNEYGILPGGEHITSVFSKKLKELIKSEV